MVTKRKKRQKKEQAKSFYIHRVLQEELAEWTSLGWMEHIRDRIPSVDSDIVLIVYHGEQYPPPLPDDCIYEEE